MRYFSAYNTRCHRTCTAISTFSLNNAHKNCPPWPLLPSLNRSASLSAEQPPLPEHSPLKKKESGESEMDFFFVEKKKHISLSPLVNIINLFCV